MKKKRIIFCIIFLILLLAFVLYYFIFKNNYDHNSNFKEEDVETSVVGGKRVNIYYTKEIYNTSNKSISSNSYRNIVTLDGDYNFGIIQKKLLNISDNNWKELKNFIAEDASSGSSKEKNLFIQSSLKKSYINSNVISFNLFVNALNLTQSIYRLEGYNFNINNGNILSIKDIVTDYDEFKKYLVLEIFNKLKDYEKNGGCINELAHDSEVSNGYINDVLNLDNSWFFSDVGFNIVFYGYSFICDDTGVFKVEIPRDEVNKYLKVEYKI